MSAAAELGVEPPERADAAARRRRSGSPRPSISIVPSQRKKSGSSCVRVARSSRSRPSFGPACVRSCGRTTRFSYGSSRSAATKPSRRRRDAVRPDVLLREPPAAPARRRGRARRAPATPRGSRRPPPRSRAASGGRRCTGFVRRSCFSLLRSDDVVRRSDERLERSADSRVVAERAERPYDCHGTDRTNRAASLPPVRPVRATTGDPSRQARRASSAELGRERGEEPDAHDEHAPEHAGAPAEAQAQVAAAVGADTRGGGRRRAPSLAGRPR